MCGINGFTKQDELLLRAMTDATAHRGPDATGYFSTPEISLGHNRLSIIDLSPEANQPMQSADGRYTIVFNGEIYNFNELRAELLTYPFKTKGDTEVLLAGYAAWGDALFNKLRGIFAFAIWDAQENELLLVRDQMGVKPLYYAFHDNTLYFSSELAGMIAGTNLRLADREAIATYLTIHYVPSPDTFIKGIKKLRPAHLLRYKNGQTITQRYWVPNYASKSKVTHAEVRSTIGEAVKRQLVSDRPVSVLLSGGLDSSIVLHHVHQHIPNIRTFSSAFESFAGPESKYNTDAILAKKTAQQYGASHTTLTLSFEEVGKNLDGALRQFDEPVANPTSISRYLLNRHMREQGIVVGLGGEGGDELFGGYDRYRIMLASWYFKKLPLPVRKGVAMISKRGGKLGLPFGSPIHMVMMAQPQKKTNSILKNEYSTDTIVSRLFDSRYAELKRFDINPVEQYMFVDRESWLVDESLTQTDRTSMAVGLELRVPLLDLDVVTLADSLSVFDRFTLSKNKKILRDAYQSLLPEYLFKGAKRGWLSPGGQWLRDSSISLYAKEVMSDSYYNGLSSMIDWNAVQDMLSLHIDGNGYHLYPLWNLLHLQVWAHKNKITV